MKDKHDYTLISEAYASIYKENAEPRKLRTLAERPNYNQGSDPYGYLDLPAVVITMHAGDGTVGDSKTVKKVKQLGYPGTRDGKRPFRDIAKGMYIYGDVYDANEHDTGLSEEFVDLIVTSESPFYNDALKAHTTGVYSPNRALDTAYRNLGWI